MFAEWNGVNMFKRAVSLFICLSLAFPAWATQDFFLADIAVDGNKRVPSADLLNAIQLKLGQTATPEDIDAAIEDIYRMGRFSDISAVVEDRAGAKVLVFKLVERPLVRNVSFEGNEEISA
jgi:outer membrane protein insertion porin family